MTTAAPLPVVTTDGVALEAEWIPPGPEARMAVLLCHPHPQYGGSMRAQLVGDLFRGLTGVAVARFNFRGVERSEGVWSDGHGERLDVVAAADAVDAAVRVELGRPLPILMVGWSFGADLALTVRDGRVVGWVAVAPPLHWTDHLDALGADARPKRIVVGARDDLVSPEVLRDATRTWRSTTVTEVPGADHFFVGATGPVVDLVNAVVAEPDRSPRS
jgi:hypothetical protein